MTIQDWQLRQVLPAVAAGYFAEGLWTDDTLPEVTDLALQKSASTPVRVRSNVRPFDGSVGELGLLGRRLAGVLERYGIGSGDVVAFQIPNWPEAIASFYGLMLRGVVLVPVVHIYGHKEMAHILRETGAKALITADAFGRQDFVANLHEIEASLPALELVIVVETTGTTPLAGRWRRWDDLVATAEPLIDIARVHPDDPAIISYTSGTTASPKGVVHTHRTLLGELRQYDVFFAGDTEADSHARGVLSSAPLGHVSGLLVVQGPLGICRSWPFGGPLQMMDAWNPEAVLAALRTDDVSTGFGPPFFLTSLLDHPDFDPSTHPARIGRVRMGASAVPAEVAARAASLGINLTRSYGSTEHPTSTMSRPWDPEEKRSYTDGRAMPGVELRIVDDDGRTVERGVAGEILTRGPDLFVGYVDPELTATVLDRDGWYSTGDIGVVDDQGFLSITDRKKDIIIRGGENISASEVEGALQRHAAVAEVAVVAAPDARYGERACAFVRLASGVTTLGLDAVRDHLGQTGLARQKWPEEVRLVDDFPRTASGKIRKNVLRDGLRAEVSGQDPR